MYAWYGESKVCYAYLEDVVSDEDPRVEGSTFWKSVWFTRGWTLQGLIAPASVVFFAKDWAEIGSKASLADVIEEITNVNRAALVRTTAFKVSIATRISWAANRQTARVEDRAYSLLGLLGVNMPVIYGEGTRAFKRLQNEILRMSTDHSIFAWEIPDQRLAALTATGMLASSPDEFAGSTLYDSMRYTDFAKFFGIEDAHPDYSMTNFGLRVRLPLVSFSDARKDKASKLLSSYYYDDSGPLRELGGDHCVAFIACLHGTDSEFTWIFLRHPKRQQEGHFVRTSKMGQSIFHGKLQKLPKGTSMQQVVIGEEDPSIFETFENSNRKRSESCEFDVDFCGCSTFEVIEQAPLDQWVQNNRLYIHAGTNVFGVTVFRSSTTNEKFAVVLGHDLRVWSDLITCSEEDTATAIHDDYKTGLLSQRRWLGLDWVTIPRVGNVGSEIVMTVRRGQDTNNNRLLSYVVKIATRELRV